MPATMSILGLLTALPSLLDPLTVEMPTAQIAEAVKTGLLAESAELEVVYPNPQVFKQVLSAYVIQRETVWTNLYRSTQIEFNPIYNYDRTEEETISREHADNSMIQSSRNGETHSTGSGSDTDTGSSHRGADTRATGSSSQSASSGRYGYNVTSSASPEAESSSQDNNSSTTLTGEDVSTQGERSSQTQADSTLIDRGTSTEESSGTGSETRTVRAYGNIGVTTTMQMLTEYREQQFDFVQFVIDDVIGRFCLMVY